MDPAAVFKRTDRQDGDSSLKKKHEARDGAGFQSLGAVGADYQMQLLHLGAGPSEERTTPALLEGQIDERGHHLGSRTVLTPEDVYVLHT